MYRPHAVGTPGSRPLFDAETLIRGLTQDLCTAFNTGNYDHAAALFSADALFLPPHRASSEGPRSIERALREFSDSGYQDLRFETTRVDCSGDMAVEIGRYSVAIRRGSTMLSDHGNYMRSWHRLGKWLIAAECWNSNLPLADEIWLGVGARVA